LRSLANPLNVQGMARYGINPQNTLGVSMVQLRAMARRVGRNHQLALELWASGIHEARILAALVDDPRLVTEEQAESWVGALDSWDVCDQLCGNLLDRTALAYRKAEEWCGREETFVKRAGFVLIAQLAVHDKKAGDEPFLGFLPLVRREAGDDRNFVKKAVNWALRHIGKRNARLNLAAIEMAREIRQMDSRSARWIASDALRELTGEAVQQKVRTGVNN
ncbi:MAG TPA: DNA alkylation repair protein, partial [Chloroflexota bacterium]|nr:DNA alkylation repair protein [Chloroflexota bacterium]